MRKIMDSEQADMLAQEIEADLTSPGSFHQMTEFPGYEALGLNPDLPEDDTVADAIGSAMRASSVRANEDFGRLSAMIQYGIVNVSDIKIAIHRWSISTHEENPMHDAS